MLNEKTLKISLLLLVGLLFGCRTEYRETIETYSNGKIKSEFVYPDKKNTSDYSIINYFENGNISFKGIVKNKKFVGEKINYFENGNIQQTDSLIKPCELDFCCCDGKVTRYYSNGELNQMFYNKNGNAEGELMFYSEDSTGILEEITEYSNGKKNGLRKVFYESGKIYLIKKFRNDTLIDKVYYFDENGDSLKYYHTWKGNIDFPTKKWLTNGGIFYADYLEDGYDKVLYRWEDKNGIEIKREIISKGEKSEWISDNGDWITPN